MYKWGPLFSLVKIAIYWGCPTFVLIEFFEVLKVFAGEKTEADISIFVKFFAEFGFYAPWTIATGTTILAVRERRLRKRKVREMSQTIRNLEEAIDPNRESSNLTETGDTNPEDET